MGSQCPVSFSPAVARRAICGCAEAGLQVCAWCLLRHLLPRSHSLQEIPALLSWRRSQVLAWPDAPVQVGFPCSPVPRTVREWEGELRVGLDLELSLLWQEHFPVMLTLWLQSPLEWGLRASVSPLLGCCVSSARSVDGSWLSVGNLCLPFLTTGDLWTLTWRSADTHRASPSQLWGSH